MNHLEYLVFLGAIVSLSWILHYVRETLTGSTKPNRVTWLMWMIAPLIGSFAAISDGVGLAVLPVFMAGFGPLLVLIASFRNKETYWKLEKSDYLCGILSIVALILWAVTKEPIVAIIFAILSDAFAAIPTLQKSWTHPETESFWPYLGSLLSVGLSIFAFRTFTASEVSFPIYLIIVNVLLVAAILSGKWRKRLS